MAKKESYGDYGDSRSGVMPHKKIPVSAPMNKTEVTNTAGNSSRSEKAFARTLSDAINNRERN